ncbi:MAG TPA: TldD/PmbA family protein [Candidatus Coprenecus stercoripullorum]|nr:TldD/PmbA family protein [Candidatus Coprenecus stercoripullorum]
MDKNIAEYALTQCIRHGATAARITLSESDTSSLSLLNGETDRIQESACSSLELSVFVDGRYGTFSTNRMEPDELRRFISECIASCRLLVPDSFRKLPDKSLYYTGKGQDLKVEDRDFRNISMDSAKSLLLDAYGGTPADSRTISVANEYEQTFRREYMIDSQGLAVEDSRTVFSISGECTVKGDGDSRPQGWWCDNSILFRDLPSTSGNEAHKRAVAMIGAGKMKSGRYNIVVEPAVSSRMVSPVINALYGSAIQQKNSFLAGTLGKRVFPESLTLSDNPLIPGSLGAAHYDGEGAATGPMDIIRNGEVAAYFLDTYNAGKLSMQRTTDSPCALFFPAHSGLDTGGIIEKAGTGILITGFNGGNCNSATGDFSYGIEGFYFENGEIIRPVREMNITGNFISLWERVMFIGSDPRKSSAWQIPSLAFGDADISGL